MCVCYWKEICISHQKGSKEKHAKCQDEQKLLFSAFKVLLLEAVAVQQYLLAFNNQIYHCYTQHYLTNSFFLQVSHMKSMSCHLRLTYNCNLNTRRQILLLVQLFYLVLSSLKLRIHSLKLHSLKLHSLSEIIYVLRRFNILINSIFKESTQQNMPSLMEVRFLLKHLLTCI